MSAQLRNPLYSPFLRRAGELRRSGALCDAVVVVDGHAFRAHSLVLACASRDLERRLTDAEDDDDRDRDNDDNNDRCHNRRRCTIDALSARAFRQVLDYAYAEVLEVPVADLPGLAEAARALEMEELGRQCLAWLEGPRSSEEEAAAVSPGSADPEEETDPPPSRDSSSSASGEPKPDATLRRVSVIASATHRHHHLPAPSPTRPKLGWGVGMAPPATDFSIRTLQSSQPLLAYSFPFSAPMYPLFPAHAFPQVHDSIFSYARLFHPFHHGLLQAPQKLAASMKHGPLGKKASVDMALMDAALMEAVPGGGERKRQRTGDRLFCCSYCRREFLDTRGPQREEVTSAVPLEAPFCPFCSKDQSSRGAVLAPPPPPPRGRRWGHLCSECDRSFASTTALRRHQRQHTDEVTLGCEYCERCFKDESSLRSHRRIHSGEKPYQCQRCPKRFSLKHQLDTHYRVHTGEKPFSCNLCGQRSRDYSAMIKHLRTHGGAAPYQCPMCLEFCSSLAAMQKHLKSHPVQDFPADWSISGTYMYTFHS